MILTLKPGTTKEGLQQILNKIKELAFKAHVSKGAHNIVVGVIGDNAISAKEIFESFFTVESITPISKPYKLVSRELKREDTLITFDNGVTIGGKKVVVMGGPCSVDKKPHLLEAAREVKKAGAKFLRGGAFKPRTSPYAFQGMGEEGLIWLSEAGKKTGLLVVTEVMQIAQVELVERYADLLQVGARNIQNFDLLKELGSCKKPVLLKRGMSTTIKELLLSAEYIVAHGNPRVILCERGIRTFEDSTRFTLDLNAVPVIKKLSHLPVIVDPSHGTGIREFVRPLALAAIAAGADGLIIEVHPKPEEALSDGAQSLLPQAFHKLCKEVKAVARAIGRDL